MNNDYDVVIVGGGMVGASLACALLPRAAELKLKVAVIESQPLPEQGAAVYQPSYDTRSTALALGVRSAFEKMGIWDALTQHLTAIEHIHVSDKGHFGTTRLEASEEQVPALGYVVENQGFGQVLLQQLLTEGAPWIDYLCPANVLEVNNRAEGSSVVISSDKGEQTLTCDLVVMADGGRSGLMDKLGITTQVTPYEQHALVANISLDRSHQNIAYDRFTPTGPVALLPRSDVDGEARMGLVWTLPDDEIDSILALDDAAFLKALQDRFGYRAGRFTRVGQRYHYPLKLALADEQVRAGLVVLGNAAHSLHPIAGQGYNLAFRGLMAVADLILQRKAQGLALGHLDALNQLEQSRQSDQYRVIQFSDRTMKLFSNYQRPLSLVRSLGLVALNNCPVAKTLLARAAMGVDVPAPGLH